MNRHFSKEDIQMANGHMERSSTSLITKEIQIKTTVRFHLIPVRMAKSSKSDVGKDAEKGEPPTLLVGTQASVATLEKSVEVPQKVENRATLRPSNYTTRYLPKGYKHTD